MIRTIFKIIFEDDTCYYTPSRLDVVAKINEYHKDNVGFKQYNINTINGVLYNHNKKTRGVVGVESFAVREFYKEYITAYTKKISGSDFNMGKPYSEKSIKRLQNQFINFINMEILTQKNTGVPDDTINEYIYKLPMLAC